MNNVILRDQDVKNIFSKNLDILISQKNWTVKQAAGELKYYRNDLAKILSGKKNFQLNTAVRIAKYFDVSVFIMFDRLFEIDHARFHYVDVDYAEIIRINFKKSYARQSNVSLDATTVSHFMNRRRNNPTIKTVYAIAEGAGISVSDLLKTKQDEEIIKN